MDKSKVKEIVDEVRGIITVNLHLTLWEISYFYEIIDGTTRANCIVFTDYEQAEITIDFEKMDSKATVLQSLIHEYLHIMNAQMWLYRSAVKEHIADERAFQALDHVWQHSMEMTVLRLERMIMFGLGWNNIRLSTGVKNENCLQDPCTNV